MTNDSVNDSLEERVRDAHDGFNPRNIIATWGLIALSLAGINEYTNTTSATEPTTTETVETTKDRSKPTTFATGDLKDAKLHKGISTLHRWYTGINGTVPDTVTIDYDERLERLWDTKIQTNPNSQNLRDVAHDVTKDYNATKATTMNLQDYIETATTSLETVRNELDWKRAQSQLRRHGISLHDNELQTVQAIMDQMTGEDLISYAMTEVMESKTDGEHNAATLDFLLKTAGREYVENIPAFGDKLISLGPYQHTQWSVYDTGDQQRGASIINDALPSEHQIPGSVRFLEGNDHHRAASLFAIVNFSLMMESLTDQQHDVFVDKMLKNHDDLVTYMAAAHHSPYEARQIMQRCLDNNGDKDLPVSAHGRFLTYMQKTEHNHEAVHDLHQFDYVGENSKRRPTFETIVKPGMSVSDVARAFNTYDRNVMGDSYEDVSTEHIRKRNGERAAEHDLQPGNDIFVVTD